MKVAIQEYAAELGFDACRITTAEPPLHAEHLASWLDEGRHGEMAYLKRNAEKRMRPEKVLPGAKSVISLAASYHDPGERQAGAKSGVVARYARYADYHEVMEKPLEALARRVDELGGEGTRSLWYVDTGPVLERDLAERSGIGFVGKHTNLIGRGLGNWFLLAEILTTLELEPDEPEKNHCGTCTRCMTACPTLAITAPFRLDARRCISYLTIELKSAIPLEFRRSIGNRIFGCDDCLAVCPWNRFAVEGRLMSEHRQSGAHDTSLTELLELTDDTFRERFRGTPIARSKRRGFLRNVCVALGNVGDRSALPHLERRLSDHEPLIGEHARWAIDEIENRDRASHPFDQRHRKSSEGD